VLSERLQLYKATGAIENAAAFLLGVQAQHHIKKGGERCSYGLKHLAQYWFQVRGESVYIPNGAMIVAILLLELPAARREGSPNISVALCPRWHTRIFYEIHDRLDEMSRQKGSPMP